MRSSFSIAALVVMLVALAFGIGRETAPERYLGAPTPAATAESAPSSTPAHAPTPAPSPALTPTPALVVAPAPATAPVSAPVAASAPTAVPLEYPVILSHAQALEVLHRAGWAQEDMDDGVCVMRHESSLNRRAHNSDDPGQGSFGLFQINSWWAHFADIAKIPRFDLSRAFDAVYNASYGLRIFRLDGWASDWVHSARACGLS